MQSTIFHVFDSQVAASVSAKGRSSSKALNRVCRRLCAILCSPPTLSVSLSGQSLAGNSATLDPGSRSLTTMVRRRRLVPVRRAHLKFVGIERKTQRRYNKAVEKFFIFCTFFPWFRVGLFAQRIRGRRALPERGRRGRRRSSVPTDVPKPHEHSASIPAQLGPDTHGPSGAPAPALCSPGHRRSRGALRGLGDGRGVLHREPLLVAHGEILTLKVQHVVHYEESGKSVLCLPDSKGAKRRDVSEFVCVGPRPGRKTTPADHDGRQELGRLCLRAHVGLSCTWSSRVGGGGGHP